MECDEAAAASGSSTVHQQRGEAEEEAEAE